MKITVRFAESAADRESVFRLRTAIYGGELGSGHAVDAEGAMTDALDDTARLLLAEQDGEVVGTMRLNWGGDAPFCAEDRAIYRLDAVDAVLTPAQILIFSRFATRRAYRGGDAPGQLVDAMVRFALAHGVALVLCDCRPELINTYLRLGMRVCGPLATTSGAGLLVPLALLLDDREHLVTTRSRIAAVLAGTEPDPARGSALRALLPSEPAVRRLDFPEEAPGWTRIVDTLVARQPGHSAGSWPIFDGLSPEQVARLATSANVLACQRGDVVVRDGSAGEMVFVVLEGEVEVVRRGAAVARVGPGGVVGDIAFLARTRRTADVVVLADARLLCLRASTLNALIADEPVLAATFLLNLSRILAARVAATTAAARWPDLAA